MQKDHTWARYHNSFRSALSDLSMRFFAVTKHLNSYKRLVGADTLSPRCVSFTSCSLEIFGGTPVQLLPGRLNPSYLLKFYRQPIF
jgi:hypothetical protein